MSEFNKRLIFVLFILIIMIFIFSYLSFFWGKSKYLNVMNVFKYRRIQKNFKDESDIPSYKSNQEKYKKKSCDEVCDKKICLEYEEQMKKYNMCKRCESKGLCYEPFQGSCFKCTKLKSCEESYGCEYTEPINPFKNECNTCWPKIY